MGEGLKFFFKWYCSLRQEEKFDSDILGEKKHYYFQKQWQC